MTVLVIVVAAVAVVALAALVFGVVVVRRRQRPDGVAAFQRHIEALSPEARRPVVDRVQQLGHDAAAGRRHRDEDGRRRA